MYREPRISSLPDCASIPSCLGYPRYLHGVAGLSSMNLAVIILRAKNLYHRVAGVTGPRVTQWRPCESCP
jgi:hypothetical protein